MSMRRLRSDSPSLRSVSNSLVSSRQVSQSVAPTLTWAPAAKPVPVIETAVGVIAMPLAGEMLVTAKAGAGASHVPRPVSYTHLTLPTNREG